MEAAYYGCQLMRNNSGAFSDKDGRQIRFGLGNISKQHSERIKSSDLIGFTSLTITPEMVGQKVAVFTAIECKESEWKPSTSPRERAQSAFIEWVKKNGGIAGFASSVSDLIAIIKGQK